MVLERDYTEADLEASLKRFFKTNSPEATILIDGHECRSQFKRDGVNYGIDQGWLEVDEDINEDQYGAVTYKLTELGKKHFKLR